MEVGATGLPGLSAVASAIPSSAGDDTAFAAALGVFGGSGAMHQPGKAALIGGASSGPPLQASVKLRPEGLSLTESETTEPSGEYAFVGLPGFIAASPRTIPMGQRDLTSNIGADHAVAAVAPETLLAPPAPEKPIDQGSGISVIQPLVSDGLAPGGLADGAVLPAEPLSKNVLADMQPPQGAPVDIEAQVPITGSEESNEAQPFEAVHGAAQEPATGLLQRIQAATPEASEASDAIVRLAPKFAAEPSGGSTQQAAAATATDAAIDSMVRAPIAASAKPAEPQSFRVEHRAGQEFSSGTSSSLPAIADASETPNSNSEAAADLDAEPLGRLVQNAAPERALPTSANPAPLPPASGIGQAAPAPQAVESPGAAAQAQVLQTEDHRMASFQADKVVREMGIQIARRVANGGDELVIRLDPAELGRINIRMSVNEQGQLRATVTADLPSVVEAIRSDIPELSRALEQAGVRTDNQSFRFDKGANGESAGQWQQPYKQQNAATRNDAAGDLTFADDEPAYRPMATNGRINMMA
jgi:flagellar hook-length control protein FliK